MNYLAQNLAVLAERYPELAAELNRCDSIESQKLYGADPQPLAVEALDKASLAYPKLVVFYGAGSGHLIQEFFKRCDDSGPQAEHVLLVESSLGLFKHALELTDWSTILRDTRVTLKIGVPTADMTELFTDYLNNPERLVYIRALVSLCDIGSMKLDGDYYRQAAEAMQAVTFDLNALVFCSPEDSYRGFINILDNLIASQDVPVFDSLVDRFNDFPGIAISTGPSLEKSLPWLKQVQDQAVLACTDSALKILLEHDIVPHFVGCLERVPETRLLFEDLPQLKDTWLVCNPVIWPESYQNYPGPKINMMRPIGQLKWFYPQATLWDTGSSSSHLIFKVLEEIGCDPILIVGQDLAFDRHSERTHVNGIPQLLYDVGQKQRKESSAQAQSGQGECEVEGNNGQPILTMGWYNQFRKILGHLIRYSQRTCYNISPADYGAKIPHAILKPPDEALSLLTEGPRSIADEINESLSNVERPSMQEFMQTQEVAIQKALDYLELYRSSALDVLDAVSRFRQRYSPVYFDESVFTPLLKRVEAIGYDLFEDVDDFHDGFFLAQVQHKTFAISQVSEELLKGELTETQRIERQFTCIQDWFTTTLQWSSRMERFLHRYYEDVFQTQTKRVNDEVMAVSKSRSPQ